MSDLCQKGAEPAIRCLKYDMAFNADAATRFAWIRLGALALLLIGLGIVAATSGTDSIRSFIENASSGWRGALAFVGIYAIGTVLLVPGSASTVTAGLLFGTIAGTAVAVVGATAGATMAYGIARGVGRRPVEELLAPKGARIDGWVAEHQFRSVLVLRLLPIFPFNLVNYAAGLSAVRPAPYVVGTLVGIVPGALLFAGLGSSARQPLSPAFVAMVVAAIAVMVGSGFLARRLTQR